MNTIHKTIFKGDSKEESTFYYDGDMLTAITQCITEAKIDLKHLILQKDCDITSTYYSLERSLGKDNKTITDVVRVDKDGVAILIGLDGYTKKEEPGTIIKKLKGMSIVPPIDTNWKLKKAFVTIDETVYNQVGSYDNPFLLIKEASDYAHNDLDNWEQIKCTFKDDEDKDLMCIEYVIPIETKTFSGYLKLARVNSSVVKLFIGGNTFILDND